MLARSIKRHLLNEMLIGVLLQVLGLINMENFGQLTPELGDDSNVVLLE